MASVGARSAGALEHQSLARKSLLTHPPWSLGLASKRCVPSLRRNQIPWSAVPSPIVRLDLVLISQPPLRSAGLASSGPSGILFGSGVLPAASASSAAAMFGNAPRFVCGLLKVAEGSI